MTIQNAELIAFNRGLISKLALARIDLKRAAMSAEIQTNWMPRVLGSMMFRPGFGYFANTSGNNKCVVIPFIADEENVGNSAAVELTNNVMRVLVNDIPVTRPTVTAAVTNGAFNTDLTGWTDNDDAGATSQWIAGGYMGLQGTGFAKARRTQGVTVVQPGVVHALNIVILRGPITFKLGSTSGGDDYIAETTLFAGQHSLSFTPAAGTFYIDFSGSQKYTTLIDSVAVAPAGIMEIPTPWATADLPLVRVDTSGDVVFVACAGQKQKRIERRSTTSWSIVDYVANDGPFRVNNLSTITLTPSALYGDITVTASANLFKSTQVGALYRISSNGQVVNSSLTGDNQYTNNIRVTGLDNSRRFTILRTGTWVGTITLQRSLDGVSGWEDVTTYTTNASTIYDDGLDNQIWYYRIGFKPGGYTSGTLVVTLTYTSGSLDGIVRITGYTNATTVSAIVLKELGGTSGTLQWAEGTWSDYRGYPSAVCLFEGRLWWAGKDKIFGSVSDAFDSFDDTIEGDSAPIQRSIGSGPVARINWLLPLLRMVVGTKLSERTARSSSLDEPLTPGNFNLKVPSTRGTSPIPAIKIDSSGAFVRDTRMFLLTNTDSVAADYVGTELTLLCPEIGKTGFVRLAVQRYPDTRIHGLLADGTVAVLVFDDVEEVKCWVKVETPGAGGVVEEIYVMPGDTGSAEDKVTYVVRRTVNGSTVRFHERWALESECVGSTLNKQADSFITYSGAPTTTINVPHLKGQQVVVWADGKDFSPLKLDDSPTTFLVNAGTGNITLPTAVSNAVIGLYYEAPYKSYKLAYAGQLGSSLGQDKIVTGLALVASNMHAKGVQFGVSLDNLSHLPEVEDTGPVDPNYIWDQYDKMSFEVDGEFGTDTRIFLKASSPRPVTVLGLVPTVVTSDKA